MRVKYTLRTKEIAMCPILAVSIGLRAMWGPISFALIWFSKFFRHFETLTLHCHTDFTKVPRRPISHRFRDIAADTKMLLLFIALVATVTASTSVNFEDWHPSGM
jgi:hypothetical protein